MRTIALEEHFVTADFLKATNAYAGGTPGDMRQIREQLLDLGEGRLQAMRENGIDLQVLSLAAMGIEKLDANTAVAVLRDVNDELAAAVTAQLEHFRGFASLPLRDPTAAARELERCVRTLGFVGAMVDGTVDGLFLDHLRFTPLWEAAHALGVPIYLHPAPPPAAVMQAYYSGLPDAMCHLLSIAGWGWHAETGLHSLRLIVSGLFDCLPGLQLIIGHMGEGLPYALARSSNVLSGSAKHLQRPVSEYFLHHFHITTSGYFTRPPFDCAEEVVGIDRMMFSVDYPFSPNTKGRAFLDSLNPMNNHRRAKLVHGNAERVLKLAMEP